ncbi:sigma-54 dependent transcriptional regulator [Pseudoxanthomonas putridarboris]|uniref:Sigma-54 dependent transcriptional regulator n=1 Tax=Pseudoxanthomonas putridarboris TaxID=752605 RepID=A0ABU9J531_9GAMM
MALSVIGTLAQAPAPAMACYRPDAAGKVLLPIAGMGVAMARLPQIGMSTLEHPAVYCLVQGKACLVTDAKSSLHADAGLGSLVAAMKAAPALLSIPLRDRERNQAVAVLILGGTADELRRFQHSDEWSALLDIFQRLLAYARQREQTQPDATKRGKPSATTDGDARRVEEALVGRSVVARRLRADVIAAAESQMSVLITGETGVGKDHAAWLIHQVSPRRSKAFVPLNCAAIAPDLIAAELFGAAKGAYTGADRSRPGLVAAADGGTLFLDEIGDMPLPLQGTLLRLLNEKRYRPLGEVEERSSDFRLICATHRPLPELVRQGQFREDLYFRIRQLSLSVPALRERRADILVLAEHAIAQHNREQHANVTGLSAEAGALLIAHDFPGNVRELLTLIQVACERVDGTGLIDADGLRGLLVQDKPAEGTPSSSPDASPLADSLMQTTSLVQACEIFEKKVIADRLKHFNGSRLRAARSLGIPRRTLAHKCKKFGLEGTP